MTDQDRTLLSRHECKYVVSHETARRLQRAIQPFVRPDRHGLGPGGDGYPIMSLYLDTPDLMLMRQTLSGVKNRFKLRIRTYTDDGAAPVYFEVKRRMDGVVLKSRAGVARDGATELLARSLWGPRPAGAAALDELVILARTTGAGPVARVRYLRQAYESAGGDPVRVTFDSHIAHARDDRWDLRHGGSGWHPTSVAGIVLEIKFTERFPAWLSALVRTFELERCSFAKYALSMVDTLARESRGVPATELASAG